MAAGPSATCSRATRATAASIERASFSLSSAAAGPDRFSAASAVARRAPGRRSWLKNQIRSPATASAARLSPSSSHSTHWEPARSMRSSSWASIVVACSLIELSMVQNRPRTPTVGRTYLSVAPGVTSSGRSARLMTST